MKTINEIRSETTSKLYYRNYDKARAIALTKAAEELNAEIRIATPFICFEKDRHGNIIEDDNGTFVLGLWAHLVVDGEEIYIEMNSNIFFDAYVTKMQPSADRKTRRRMYGYHGNDALYENIDWDGSTEEISRLTKNIKNEIMRVISTPVTHANSYIENIPTYERNHEQIIYTRY